MIWLILSIVAWGFLHSITASLSFKNHLRRMFGEGMMKFYRLLYNLFAGLSITPILYLLVVLPDNDFYSVPGLWSYILRAAQGFSFALLIVSLLQTDVLSFLGLRQFVAQNAPAGLVTNGVYQFVRHPLYTFSLGILWFSPTVSLNYFVICISFTAYILIGIVFEERKLLHEFGQAYADYCSVTPMLIPGLKFGWNK
jgi:protein-S-isoprenylcysteine O-methyltransferase Ste14